jgi:hypothetical protein
MKSDFTHRLIAPLSLAHGKDIVVRSRMTLLQFRKVPAFARRSFISPINRANSALVDRGPRGKMLPKASSWHHRRGTSSRARELTRASEPEDSARTLQESANPT